MQYVNLDEAGPLFFTSQSQKLEQVHILIAVELVTYRSHLVPMKDTSAKSLIRALEQLQSLRGKLSTIILDETKSHSVLISSPGNNALGKTLVFQ